MLQGSKGPDGVADVLRGEAGQLIEGVLAQHLQEGRRGLVLQGGIGPNHVGHTLGLEVTHEGKAVPGCCIHQLRVQLLCTGHTFWARLIEDGVNAASFNHTVGHVRHAVA